MLVLSKIRNDPKRTETNRNQPKRPKTNLQNDPNFQNWENLEFCTSFRFSNFQLKCLNLSILGEVSTF